MHFLPFKCAYECTFTLSFCLLMCVGATYNPASLAFGKPGMVTSVPQRVRREKCYVIRLTSMDAADVCVSFSVCTCVWMRVSYPSAGHLLSITF